MALNKGQTPAEQLEKAAAKRQMESYVLRLYVAGLTPQSILAITNVRKICEQHLANRYELEVIDIYQQPELSKKEQIIATPALIKSRPLPLRRLIGNMSDTDTFLAGIDLKPKLSRARIHD